MSGNRLLTRKEFAKEIHTLLLKACGGDIKKYRAVVYDVQTSWGGFPSSRKERRDYINGVSNRAKPSAKRKPHKHK